MTLAKKIIQIEIQGINKASGPLSSVGSALAGLIGSAAGAGAALAVAGVALIAVGVGAVAAAAKIVAYVDDCVEAATEFEAKMAILDVAASRLDLTVTNLAGETLEGLHDVMLQVGLDTKLFGIDAVEATAATTEFVKAGLSETEMFGDLQGYIAGTTELTGGLRAAIDLATASELNHEDAARFATIALSTYGSAIEGATERALFMNEAVDHTVRAADASTASVTGLTEGLEAFGPIANMFGIGLEDTNILLAILSDRGIEGAEAGTGLRSMFKNLTRDVAKVNEMYATYGITLYDANGEMLSAREIVGQFEEAIVGLTEEEKHLLIQTTAGAYGQKALNALLIEGTEGWDDMAQSIVEASSVTEIAAARTNTLAGQQEILEGQIQTLNILVGEQFIPVWRQMTQWFTTILEGQGPSLVLIFKGIASGVEVVANIITGPLSAALGRLLMALGLTEEAGTGNAEMWGFVIGKLIELTAGGLLATMVIGIDYLTYGINIARSAAERFRNMLEWIEGVLWRVQNALKWVRDWINAVNTAFNALNIPYWLRPGSPAPLETALLGIHKAFQKLPEMSFGISATSSLMTAPSTGATMSPIYITNHFGTDSVRSDQDIQRIADTMQEVLELQGIRGRIS